MLSPFVMAVSPGRLFTKEFAYSCRPASVPKTAAALVDETGVWSRSQPAARTPRHPTAASRIKVDPYSVITAFELEVQVEAKDERLHHRVVEAIAARAAGQDQVRPGADVLHVHVLHVLVERGMRPQVLPGHVDGGLLRAEALRDPCRQVVADLEALEPHVRDI